MIDITTITFVDAFVISFVFVVVSLLFLTGILILTMCWERWQEFNFARAKWRKAIELYAEWKLKECGKE